MSRYSPPRPQRQGAYDDDFGEPEYIPGYRRRTGDGYEPRNLVGSRSAQPLRHVERLGNKTRIITQSQPYGAEAVSQPNVDFEKRGSRPPISHRVLAQPYSSAPGETRPRRRPEVIIRNDPEQFYSYDDDPFASDFDSPVSVAGSDVSFNFDVSFIQNGSSGFEDEPIASSSTEKGPPKESGDGASGRGTFNETVHRVVRSHYVGDVQARGDIIAELTTEEDRTSNSRVDSTPLMTWIHLESQYPSFQGFLEHARKLPGLSDDERQDTVALLQRSRETHERPNITANGSKGKYFEPCFDEETTFSRRGKQKSERKVRVICLPYFSLAPYSGYSMPAASSLHPTKTLLQYSYGSTSKERDLEQAVCRLDYSKKGECFHVPQIWCLILDNHLLLTCSRLSSSEIQRTLINVEVVPSSQGHNRSTYLCVSDGGGRIWLLPAKDCRSWFQFIANFRNTSPSQNFEEEYDLLYKGSIISSNQWGAFTSQMREESIKLTIRKKRFSYRAATFGVNSPEPSDSGSMADDEDPDVIRFNDDYAEQEQRGDFVHNPATPKGKNPETTEPSNPESSNNIETSTSNFHYFYWLAAASPLHSGTSAENGHKEARVDNGRSLKFSVQIEKINNLFSSMQTFLHSMKSKKRAAYRKCPLRTLAEVDDLLAASTPEVEQSIPVWPERDSRPRMRSSRSRSRSRRRYPRSRSRSRDREVMIIPYQGRSRSRSRSRRRYPSPPQAFGLSKQKAKVLKTAKEWFRFFLPLYYTSNLIAKYWGAVYYLLEDDERFREFYKDFEYSIYKRNVSQKIQSITSTVSDGKGPLPWDITLPQEFGKVWLHILMFFILSKPETSSRPDQTAANGELVRADDLLLKGHRLFLRNAAPIPLTEREAVLPLGIVSLIAKKLLQDVTSGQPDICSTYYEYFKQLEHEVQSNPYSRSHQEKISYLRQEISTIITVLTDQLQVLDSLSTKTGQQSAIPDFYRFPKEREYYILRECIFSIKAKMQSFREMGDLASDLGVFNIRRIEANKDRQEAAILVFTIVTIIFLPLSFVSSFLGMNTIDIRNTNSSQWLFWATAVPVTVIVVGLALVFALKVEPTRQLWGRFQDHLTVGSKNREMPVVIESQATAAAPMVERRYVSDYIGRERYGGWERENRDHFYGDQARRPMARQY